jgi:hypothetical protein
MKFFTGVLAQRLVIEVRHQVFTGGSKRWFDEVLHGCGRRVRQAGSTMLFSTIVANR